MGAAGGTEGAGSATEAEEGVGSTCRLMEEEDPE